MLCVAVCVFIFCNQVPTLAHEPRCFSHAVFFYFLFFWNPQDIAPNNAGQIKGLADTFGCAAGFFANISVGMLSHASSVAGVSPFTSSFIVLASLQGVGALVFLTMSGAEPRH